ESYGDVASHYAQIAEEEHVEVFCPLVEMDSLEQYTYRVKALLDRIDVQFSGELAIDSSIHNYLSQWGSQSAANYESFLQNVGKFYDWVDDHGRPLRIDMNCWGPPLETQKDQRFSVMVESFVRFWSVAAAYFRAKYPGSRLSFGEIGTYNFDGMGMLSDLDPYPDKPGLVRDDQEFADIWAAYLYGFQTLELDELAVWAFDAYWAAYGCN
ncbi:MAG: hypothetical protein NTV92_00340, partial [Candidatus Bipolaricaulota bacterium]|nr:hypothetical protein [Candidatus Bipolaricaulota bacterium]